MGFLDKAKAAAEQAAAAAMLRSMTTKDQSVRMGSPAMKVAPASLQSENMLVLPGEQPSSQSTPRT